MLFNSLDFLLFFPIVIFLYFIIPHKFRWALLLIASYYFYMNWKAGYALLLGAVTLINYSAGLLIERVKTNKVKKTVLMSAIILSLSTLFYYKYFNFFGESVNAMFALLKISINISLPEIILPVGISFFTFQALSYSIDVYRGDMKAEKHLGIFSLFVSFFPQLVAGPIERATNLLPQFYEKHKFDPDKTTEGLRLMLWGMFKKVVVADRIAIYVNAIYNNHEHHSGLSFALATVLFAFQLYCDFSAYSDLARGSARIMGFDLMVNFKFPYFSESVTKYWQKNHISLTTWFMDYVYFPLVEKNPTIIRLCIGTFITFLLSGLWHGAEWSFVFWGIWQAVFLIYDILIRKKRKKINKKLKEIHLYKISLYSRYLITFIILCIGLIFFRAKNVNQGFEILKGIFTNKPGGLFVDAKTLVFSFLSIILLLVMEYDSDYDINEFWGNMALVKRWSCYLITIIFIIFLGVLDESQFIYFQF